MRSQLHQHYNNVPGSDRVFHALESGASRSSNILMEAATFYSHVVRHGRRIVPINQAVGQSRRSVLIKVVWEMRSLHGEVMDIFKHQQQGHGSSLWAEVRWLQPCDDLPLEINPWIDL
jgi:heterodisulfide reductase subunit C